MDDSLKKYIDSQREDFDPYVPADMEGMWDEVAKGMEKQAAPKRRVLWPRMLKVAAMALLAMGLAWLVLPHSQPIAQHGPQEFQEAQQFYAAAIQEKMQALEAKKGAVDASIFEDIEALDQALLELKVDLKDNADNEEVVNAMIRNYQIKLKILEQILEQLNEDEGNNQERSLPRA